MSEEGLTAQDRCPGADAGMIITKDILGSIKKDAFFFAGELLINADPFHCSTSADEICRALPDSVKLTTKNIERC
jgi:hypothetical protein